MRIVIADPHASTRSALEMFLKAQPDVESVVSALDLTEALARIKTTRPHVVVLDWDDLGRRIDMLQDLLQLFDEPPVIVGLSVREERCRAAKDAGVTGIAYKGDPPERLLALIRAAGSAARAGETANQPEREAS
jgi:DNA-binding NarL/FixJ family response regulator